MVWIVVISDALSTTDREIKLAVRMTLSALPSVALIRIAIDSLIVIHPSLLP
jgi:hypothetical protein